MITVTGSMVISICKILLKGHIHICRNSSKIWGSGSNASHQNMAIIIKNKIKLDNNCIEKINRKSCMLPTNMGYNT